MAHRIVLLNLADRGEGGGLVNKAKIALEKKYPPGRQMFLWAGNEVNEFRLFEIFGKYKKGEGALAKSDPELVKAQNLCNNATKIMLCMHGTHSDVVSGYAEDSMKPGTPQQVITNFTDLASFTLMLLKPRQEPYNLTLIMCYGARSSNYRLNHTGMIPADELQTSFAYKYYKEICRDRRVRMTARTGAVSFDKASGRSLVQSELSIQQTIEGEEFNQEAETKAICDRYKLAKQKAEAAGSKSQTCEEWKSWSAALTKFGLDLKARATTEQEKIIKEFKIIEDRKLNYQMETNKPGVSKYGKYVYYYEEIKDILTIWSKYPKPGVTLYEGTLI